MKLTCTTPYEPYASAIEAFLVQQFPANLDCPGTVLEAVTTAFVATSQTRQGPAPKPEGLVAIRKAIASAIDRHAPIPVLVPWGSRKPWPLTLDLAEFMALRQLQALQERVQRFHTPGITLQLGIEDLGGYYLWADESDDVVHAAKRYVEDLQALVQVLGLTDWLHAVPESNLVSAVVFNAAADKFYAPLRDWLHDKSPSALRELRRLGWHGDVAPAMVDFYLHQYEKMYPNRSHRYRLDKLAMYLGQSAARYQVGAKLAFENWATYGFVQINFTQDIPGVPATLADRRLYYRTLPMRFARTHVAPWRAKGYLQLHDGTTAQPKIVAPSTVNLEDFTKATMDLSDDHGHRVTLATDYTIVDGGRF